jgi:hypothetical protein
MLCTIHRIEPIRLGDTTLQYIVILHKMEITNIQEQIDMSLSIDCSIPINVFQSTFRKNRKLVLFTLKVKRRISYPYDISESSPFFMSSFLSSFFIWFFTSFTSFFMQLFTSFFHVQKLLLFVKNIFFTF